MAICRNCLGLPCVNPDDLASGIDGAFYSSLDFSFLLGCPPPPCECPPGLFPRTISILASTIPPVVPPVSEPGFPIILRLQGCISLITRTLDPGSSQTAIAAAAQSMQAEWAGQQATCNAKLVSGVNCTPNDSISVCNDEQNFICPSPPGPVHVPAGTYCQTLVTTGLTQAQIDAATAQIKASLNQNAFNFGCSGVFCSIGFQDLGGQGTEWTLFVTNAGSTNFDSSSFKIFDLQNDVLLQTAIRNTVLVGESLIVVLNAQPGVPPNGFYMQYGGTTFFTYGSTLSGHNVQVTVIVNCGH